MRLLVPRPPWHAQRACIDTPVDVFFPARGRSAERAKAICAGCDVNQECAAMALADHGLEGVFGGMTTGERDRERQRRAA